MASLDLCLVASGRLDAYYEKGLSRSDDAAGVLIAAESGARLGDLDGGPPSSEFMLAVRCGPLRAASRPADRAGRTRRLSRSHGLTARSRQSCGTIEGVGTRILTVEDDERIRTAVKMALEDEGWIVEETASGEDALEAFGRQAVDVVLIDIMLPGIDGFELCRSLRKSSDVPIVMVTARADTHDVVAGLEAGADDYLTKPFAREGAVGSHPGAPAPGAERRARPRGDFDRRPRDRP